MADPSFKHSHHTQVREHSISNEFEHKEQI